MKSLLSVLNFKLLYENENKLQSVCGGYSRFCLFRGTINKCLFRCVIIKAHGWVRIATMWLFAKDEKFAWYVKVVLGFIKENVTKQKRTKLKVKTKIQIYRI